MSALVWMGDLALNVFEAVKTRRSIRKYTDKPVEKEKLLRILEAARLSPSANNNQHCHFVVVSDEAILERLLPAYKREWFVKAPIVIVACSYPSKAWSRMDGESYWKVDSAIAVENMILVAHEAGLGACWVAAFDENKVKEALRIPKEVRLIAMIPLGYPGEKKGPVTDRKSLDEIIHYEQW
jgi:nitroreductase